MGRSRELHLAAVLEVKRTIPGTMEVHLPPIIVIPVAAAAAAILELLEDVRVDGDSTLGGAAAEPAGLLARAAGAMGANANPNLRGGGK